MWRMQASGRGLAEGGAVLEVAAASAGAKPVCRFGGKAAEATDASV